MTVLALYLATLSGPDGQVIEVNPHEVVSVRPPRSVEHFAPGVKCLIHTSDGKVVVVVEDCATVHQRLEEGDQD